MTGTEPPDPFEHLRRRVDEPTVAPFEDDSASEIGDNRWLGRLRSTVGVLVAVVAFLVLVLGGFLVAQQFSGTNPVQPPSPSATPSR